MNLNDITQHAPYVTYTASASAVTFWGLHISDFAVMVTALAAVAGAATQVLTYLDRRRIDRRGAKAVEIYQNGETH